MLEFGGCENVKSSRDPLQRVALIGPGKRWTGANTDVGIRLTENSMKQQSPQLGYIFCKKKLLADSLGLSSRVYIGFRYELAPSDDLMEARLGCQAEANPNQVTARALSTHTDPLVSKLK